MATVSEIGTKLNLISQGISALPEPNIIIKIAVINASTIITDAQLAPVVAALQTQVTRDFFPYWGYNAHLIQIPTGQTPPAGAWWLTILDDADQAGVLGYHDLTSEGLPLGKVFARTTLGFGLNWTVTASHELLEMLVDPQINVCNFDQTVTNSGTFYAVEVCDPCESETFAYKIGDVLVSDFVTPTWYGLTLPFPFDFMKAMTSKFQLLAGGY